MLVYPVTRPRSAALVSPLARMLDDSVERLFGNTGVARPVRSPALDVVETDSAFIVAFDVPGVAREALKVSVQGRRVELSTVAVAAPEAPAADADAPKTEVPAAPATRALYRERGTAPYARTLSLPAEVDQAASQAKFENGVLTLTLAKKVPTGATQLSIA